MADWLRTFPSQLPETPSALLVVSAHWETPMVSVNTAVQPPLLYDYSGFPEHTYQLTWPALGAPLLADRVRKLLAEADVPTRPETLRGFDHGVFIPLKVAFPEAQIPTVQLSLRSGLEPDFHQQVGAALAPLRDEGVLIIGSGMSYHNLRGYETGQGQEASVQFHQWLEETVTAEPSERGSRLNAWSTAPGGRVSHPREEHLLPLMVAAGAAGDDRGSVVFRDEVLGTQVAAVQFG
jgi:aromatic ring-opening dioxygenase catalytic subunit (LigB family)